MASALEQQKDKETDSTKLVIQYINQLCCEEFDPKTIQAKKKREKNYYLV